MASRAPGVSVTEKAGGPPRARAVSASVAGLVGFTRKGPVGVPTLVSGFTEFVDRFGSFTEKSLLPTAAYIILNTGSDTAWVSRVVAADAVKSAGDLVTAITDEDTGQDGDGGTTDFAIDLGTNVQPSSLALTAAGVAATGSITAVAKANLIDGETFVLDDGVNPAVTFEFDVAGDGVTPGNETVDVSADVSDADVAATIQAAINASVATLAITAAAPVGAVVGLTNDAVGAAGNVAIVETVVDAGFLVTGMSGGFDAMSVGDDGDGNLTGDATGTIDYDTGEIAVSFTSPPGGVDLLATYNVHHFGFEMQWEGVAGDAFKVVISGNDASYDFDTASWSRFNVEIIETDASGAEITRETFDEVVLDDELDADFITTVMNDPITGSELVTVTTHNVAIPAAMSGTSVVAEVVAMSPAYDGAEKAFTGTLASEPAPGTLTMAFTFDAPMGVSNIEDDGDGGMIDSDVSPGTNRLSASYPSTIDGADLSLYWTQAPAGGTQTATYYTQPDSSATVSMAGGSDGSAIARTDVTGALASANETGIYALSTENENMTIVMPDFESDAVAIQEAVAYAETSARQDKFVPFTPPAGASPAQAKLWFQKTLGISSEYAACFYPHILIEDPLTKRTAVMPPASHFMGCLARAHADDIAQAPAGKDYGQIRLALGLERELKPPQVATLRDIGINSIVNWRETGRVIWGALLTKRTTKMEYVNERYVFMYVKKSLERGAYSFPFLKGGKSLRGRVRSYAEMFLLQAWKDGLLKGDTPAEAFYVICDASNNPVDNRVKCNVGIAVHQPAEFVDFEIERIE